MLEPKSNREIVESFYEAAGAIQVHPERGISAGDIDHIRRIFAEDIEWIHRIFGTFRGANSVINDVLIPFWENWDLSLDISRFIEDGDAIAVLSMYRATYKPTGKQVVEPVAHVWELKGGKIARFQQYVDTASINKQLEA
jgi:ketosteroid isomerase-like protein